MEDKLRMYMEDLNFHREFSGSVFVSRNGKTMLSKGYGMASHRFGIPNRPATKYRIGSLTKAFTAMAIWLLQEKGKVTADDSISRYVPEFTDEREPTIRQLLTHTSGVRNFTSLPSYWAEDMRLPIELDDLLQKIKRLKRKGKPGGQFSYSNSGYLLLTKIIETVSGVKYQDFIRKEMLDPIGLSDTGVDNGRRIIRNLAEGHSIWEEVIYSEFVDLSFPLGSYGMYSTAADLGKWGNHLLKHREKYKDLFTPDSHGAGFGWFMSRDSNRAGHQGDINGFTHHFSLYFKEQHD